ncbi:MAG: hypothetical protein IJO22_02630 [Oscillospiraceae bacterium]|nr:hypothetical protein [Oscillospiraceae bacterium]
MKKVVLILAALLLLCSCGKETFEKPEVPEDAPVFEETNPGENCSLPEDFSSEPEKVPEETPEKIPKENPDFEFEKPEILYPENIPEELFKSAAFAEAMERPSVILYDYEPISDCLAAVNFVEAAEKGEHSELYIYNFHNADQYNPKNAYCFNYICEENVIVRKYEDYPDWGKAGKSSEIFYIDKAYINDFGFFTTEKSGFEPNYHQVISDFALYENAAEHRALKEKYIDPIFTITVSPEEFSSVSDLSSYFIWIFEDIYNYENGHDPWQEYGNNWPLSEIISLLNRYFEGVTKEMVLINRRIEYDPETDTVFYEGGRGGVSPERRVFDFEQNGDILTLYYLLYHEESGTIYDDRYYALEIKLLDDGSFRYISQTAIEKER